MGAPNAIFFFDGVCNVCNRWVDFLIRRDPQGLFHFSPLQGETAKAKLTGMPIGKLETVVLLKDGKTWTHSAAILEAMKDLGFPWPFLSVALGLFPKFLRDSFYRQFAKRRYSLFGKRETCRLPTPAEAARFLP